MVSPREREERLGQRGAVLLLTGLPGAGKTALAYAVERLLYDRGRVALVVDPADPVSAASPEARQHPEQPSAAVIELARRAADAGLIVVLPFAAPEASRRAEWRDAVGAERWLEVAVRAPLAQRQRSNDFYAKTPEPRYEAPESAAAVLDASHDESSEAGARVLVDLLEARRFLLSV
jgi:adenylylsulfate kinase-like enzyme